MSVVTSGGLPFGPNPVQIDPILRSRAENFGRAAADNAGSQCPRGETGQKNLADYPQIAPEKPQDTAPDSETPDKSRKIEGLPRAGQLQVASK
jgi:hypothetical protein